MIAFSVLTSQVGYVAGNTFTIVGWDESAQTESEGFTYTFSDPYGDAWTESYFPSDDGEYSLAEFEFTGEEPTLFNLYYDDGTLVAGEIPGPSYPDSGLAPGEYCYYVTQILPDGTESEASPVECGTVIVSAPYLVEAVGGDYEISLLWEPIPGTKTDHFNFEGGDPSSPVWTIYIGSSTFNGEDMEEGDEIGIYDGELLVGAFDLDQVCTSTNQFDNDMIAFSVLTSQTGYVAGNTFTLVGWDESAQAESEAFEYTFSDPYGDAWTESFFPSEDGEYSLAEFEFTGALPTLFNVYYEDGTLVEAGVSGNTYSDTGLEPATIYCYYITQILEGGIESDPSNVECGETNTVPGAPIITGIDKSGPYELTVFFSPIPESKTGHFVFEGGDPSSPLWTIYIGGATFDGMDMEAGDEIGVYDGDLLVGTFTLDQICTPDNQYDNDVIAFSVLVSGPGYVAGNDFTMVAWDESAQIESEEFTYSFSDPYGDAWTEGFFPSEDGEYSLAEFEFTGPSGILFNLYYEDGTLVAGQIPGPSYTDYDLTAGQEYCYYVKQILAGGVESDSSNIMCETVGYPMISTDPESFEVDVVSDSTLTDYMDIHNGGNVNLDWSAEVTSTWLTLTPTSGTVDPDTDEQVDLFFDASGLDPLVTYYDTIEISSNDPEMPMLDVPVEMTVTVGIEEYEKISLLVYPNPATNAVNLQSNDDIIRISVKNSIGISVYEEKVSDEKKVTLNTSNYETGVYIVRIETKKGFFTTKVTITK